MFLSLSLLYSLESIKIKKKKSFLATFHPSLCIIFVILFRQASNPPLYETGSSNIPSCLLIPLHWELGFQHMNYEGKQTPIQSIIYGNLSTQVYPQTHLKTGKITLQVFNSVAILYPLWTCRGLGVQVAVRPRPPPPQSDIEPRLLFS